ncbi:MULTISPECIES: hypothetical protein [unclassified Arcicella]|uniref:hypothetical protein n=1 Tax=unclassified Arcicella TaxID=2644986 RepID=UPI0028585859|nr:MULTISPECIES: hypothetical protein [unclassified Arcicella]MDR6559987.1 hypothetical protein [Arcicella sp. BE51]MDR6810406.1 hypothetical protein [Arcicella sp. BE140]MDR6821756.1 hypothetical protein [Arcicella sp. BE139]
MKYYPLLAEMILEESNSPKTNLKASENKSNDADKGWLERFFDFLTPSNIYVATK